MGYFFFHQGPKALQKQFQLSEMQAKPFGLFLLPVIKPYHPKVSQPL